MKIQEVYVKMRNQALTGYPINNFDVRDPRNDVDFGMKECPDCHGKNPECLSCRGFGIVPRTAEDDENDYSDEMESRGDAQRQEK